VRFFFSAFGWLLGWWGAFVLGALDSTLLFFMPFGIDALVIYLAARDAELFWLHALLATLGSAAGASITFWIGKKAGEVGLEKLVPRRRLERVKQRVRNSGAIAIALPALLPPPFPLTPFVLTCGALDVSKTRFFSTFIAVRLFRFGAEATLARTYGTGILAVLESPTFQAVVVGFIVLAITGTTISAVLLWRSSRQRLTAA
jgi:membrane protein YqaA with SNARE-associated domain